MNKDFNTLDFMSLHQKGLIHMFNQTRISFPDQDTLASIFYEQATNHGKRTAISFKGEEITYDELNRLSNQVAYLLCQIGVQPGHVVTIFMDRGIEAYVAILGILKSGAAYLPVDTGNHQERVQYILTHSNVHTILTQSQFLPQFDSQGTNFIVTLDRLKQFQKAKKRSGKIFDREDIALCPDTNLPLKSSATDLAYIIYTSGSTGVPKGVMVEHRSVVNLAYWAQETFGLTHQSHITQNYSIAFDASVQEIFSAWMSGATLYPVPEDIQLTPSLFVPWLRENAISYWDTIPSLWYQIVNFVATQPSEKGIAFPHLEVLVLGGEVLRADKINDWVKFVNHTHKIYNVYGPTEATVTTTYYLILPDEKRNSVAIGQPVHNAEVYILGEDLHQCMPDTEGEICIGGIGLAKGYLNADELTHSSFIFVDVVGKGKQRLYKTGDIGKLLPDGNLEFVGRRDEQVKVRGYRIELAEIEIALRNCFGVDDVVVLVKDEVDNRKIIAYFTCVNEAISANEVREDLKKRIPNYFIPNHLIKLTEIPLTANGKVDKAALFQFASDENLRQNEIYQEPTTRTEKLLAKIWRETIHIEKISIHDNFFAVGGDLILSIMIRHRCELEGIRLKSIDIFQYITIKTLARYIDEHLPELQFRSADSPSQNKPAVMLSSEQHKLLPPNAGVVLPLLPHQHEMLYEKVTYNRAIYVPQLLHHYEGNMNISAFERAINVLIERHEVFRIIFNTDITPQPLQIVLSNMNYRLPYKDISYQLWQEQDDYINQEAKKEREQGFELGKWPLFHFTVYKRSETKYDILWTTHHIIIDDWSTSIFYKELSRVYSALVTQKFHPLPQQKSNFSDYLMHYLNQDFERAKVFWQRYLADMVLMEIPKDSLSENEWGQVEEVIVSLDEEHTRDLKNLAQQNNATLNMVCLAIYFLLLKKICQQDDLTIGIVSSARSEGVQEVINVIGNLINTIPLRVNTHEADTVKEIISLVKKSLFEAQTYEFVGLANIAALVSQGTSRSLIQTLFLFEDYPTLVDLENYPTLVDLGETKSFSSFDVLNIEANESNGFPLTVVSYMNNENYLVFKFEYATGFFRRDTINAWARLYLTICERFRQADQ